MGNVNMTAEVHTSVFKMCNYSISSIYPSVSTSFGPSVSSVQISTLSMSLKRQRASLHWMKYIFWKLWHWPTAFIDFDFQNTKCIFANCTRPTHVQKNLSFAKCKFICSEKDLCLAFRFHSTSGTAPSTVNLCTLPIPASQSALVCPHCSNISWYLLTSFHTNLM